MIVFFSSHSLTHKHTHPYHPNHIYTGRATIIVNFVSFTLGLLGILALITMTSVSGNIDATNYDDDQMKQAAEEMATMDYGNVWIGVAIGLARLVFNGLGIWGAYSYTVWAVGASAGVFGLECIFALVSLNLVGLVVFACFLYPHFYLVMELRNGVMSRETYESSEKQSCCCV